MSLIKFGQYYGDIPKLTIGAELGLDGNDGFDDQTLWDYHKGDRLNFVINNNQTHLLDYKFIETEIMKDTGEVDYADVKILNIDSVDIFFHSKPVTFDNDFIELVDYYTFIWAKTYESKQRHPYSDYKKYESDFLSFSELDKVILKGNYSSERKINDRTKIYAELLSDKKTIRVLTIGGNVPDTCFLYDINDIDKYKKVILDKCINADTWSDEKIWWNELIK